MAWWDYPSNFSNGLEVNSTGTLMQYINVVSGNKLGLLLLGLFFVIVFLSLKSNFSAAKSLNAAAWVSFFLTIPLAMMKILDWTWVTMVGILAAVLAFMMREEAAQGL